MSATSRVGDLRRTPANDDRGREARPHSPYAAAKASVEHYLQVYSSLFGMLTTSLRYANMYGPRQDPEGEAGVVAIFARRALAGQPVTLSRSWTASSVSRSR